MRVAIPSVLTVLTVLIMLSTRCLSSALRVPPLSRLLSPKILLPSTQVFSRSRKVSSSITRESLDPSAVRVRFAPSPTGSLHIGGARTALFNWLFARKHQGKFILRVEDTDEARSSRASEESILRDLRWLGLDVDEGPGDLGGKYGPYRQSERKDIYQAFAKQLIESGHAYPCFCTSEELQKKKDENEAMGKPNTYNGEWRDRDPVEVKRKLDAGVPYSVRFKVPDKKFFIDDLVRGRVTWNPQKALGDFIIMRSNGMPVYNFCVAVDDYLMNITHVIRAEEHLSNTIKQILVFDAMNAKPPIYAHCSLILGEDKKKLSKRRGAASVGDFKAKGYFPSAMRNYLAMIGWNPGSQQEIFTDEELIKAFDPRRIVKSPAVFDSSRLKWMNSHHISRLSLPDFQSRCEAILRNSSYFPLSPLDSADTVSSETRDLEKEFIGVAANISTKSMKFLDDVVPLTKDVLKYPFDEYCSDKRMKKVLDSGFITLATLFTSDFREGLFPYSEADEIFDPATFNDYLYNVGQTLGIPEKQVFYPTRFALTGTFSGPDISFQLRLLVITKKLLSKYPDDMFSDIRKDFVSFEERMKKLEKYLSSS